MARAQLIPNGDWETGAASGWTLTPGSGGGVCSVSAADPYDSKYHLRIGKAAAGTSSTATFSSPIATSLVGYTITLQVRYKQTTGNSGIADLSIQITDSSGTTTTILSTGGGSPTSYTFGSVSRAIASGSTVVTFTVIVSDAADAGQYEVDAMVSDNPLLGAGIGGTDDLGAPSGGDPGTISTGWLDDLTKTPSTIVDPTGAQGDLLPSLVEYLTYLRLRAKYLELYSSTPELRFTESDQADPAGRWRWRAQGDSLFLERALTAAWATFNSVLEVNVGVTQIILDGLDNTWSTSINGGGTGASIIVGGRTANSGEQGGTEFYGLSAAFANKRRMLIKGNTDAAYVELGNESLGTGATEQALLRLSDGVSLSLLAAHFFSSPTTGFWQPAANAMALVANAVERIRLNATGIGFFATAPVAQQVSGANLTNSVASGGTDDTIANYTDLVSYAADAAAIRNNLYQLSRKLKQVNDALRLYGMLT